MSHVTIPLVSCDISKAYKHLLIQMIPVLSFKMITILIPSTDVTNTTWSPLQFVFSVSHYIFQLCLTIINIVSKYICIYLP